LDNRELVEIAKKARENAYAPYSNFKVGAALLTKSGNVYKGCNVENASYGLTVCAERVAISNAISNGEKEFVKMAIACGFSEGHEREISEENIQKAAEEESRKVEKEGVQKMEKEVIQKTEKIRKGNIQEIIKKDMQESEDVLIPCGACMQVMSEFNPDLELILLDTMGKTITINLKELFPKPFQL